MPLRFRAHARLVVLILGMGLALGLMRSKSAQPEIGKSNWFGDPSRPIELVSLTDAELPTVVAQSRSSNWSERRMIYSWLEQNRRELAKEAARDILDDVWRAEISGRKTAAIDVLHRRHLLGKAFSLIVAEQLDCPPDMLTGIVGSGWNGELRGLAVRTLHRMGWSGLKPLVRAAIREDSKCVVSECLSIVEAEQWRDLEPELQAVLRSGRPSLTQRALRLLDQWKSPVSSEPIPKTLDTQAANSLLVLMDSVGLSESEVLSCGRFGTAGSFGSLAESYLDDSAEFPTGFGGLALWASVKAGNRRLFQRLWVHETDRFDSVQEIQRSALTSLAWVRLREGLSLLASGDPVGFERLAALTRLEKSVIQSHLMKCYVELAQRIVIHSWKHPDRTIDWDRLSELTVADPNRVAWEDVDRELGAQPNHRGVSLQAN